ncbi:MAG: ABC transporter, partial [Patescibacteria group bacterium]
RETKATIILTSHYMEDIKRLCPRVLIIHEGILLYDGDTSLLNKKFAQNKAIDVNFSKAVNKKDVQKFGEIEEWRELGARLSVPRAEVTQILARLIKEFPIDDVSVHEKSMEDIVSDIFTKKNVSI